MLKSVHSVNKSDRKHDCNEPVSRGKVNGMGEPSGHSMVALTICGQYNLSMFSLSLFNIRISLDTVVLCTDSKNVQSVL